MSSLARNVHTLYIAINRTIYTIIVHKFKASHHPSAFKSHTEQVAMLL